MVIGEEFLFVGLSEEASLPDNSPQLLIDFSFIQGKKIEAF